MYKSAVLTAQILIAWQIGGSALAESTDTGRLLYADHCAACHGTDLEGAPDWQRSGPDGLFPAPPHDETGHTWHHGDGMLFDYVQHGGQAVLEDLGVSFTSGMPSFGDILTDEEIEEILAFIRASWPERIQEIQAARTAAEAED